MDKTKNGTASQPIFVVHDFLTCRRVLNIMVFLGFMVNYMLRVNLTFAIVDMVMKFDNATKPPSTMEQFLVLNRSVRSIPNDLLETVANTSQNNNGFDVKKFQQNNLVNQKSNFKKTGNFTTFGGRNNTISPIQRFNSSSTFGKTGDFQSFSSVSGKQFNTGNRTFQSFGSAGGKTQFGSFQSGLQFNGSSGLQGFQSIGNGSGSSFQFSTGQSNIQGLAGGAKSAQGFQNLQNDSRQSSQGSQNFASNLRQSADGTVDGLQQSDIGQSNGNSKSGPLNESFQETQSGFQGVQPSIGDVQRSAAPLQSFNEPSQNSQRNDQPAPTLEVNQENKVDISGDINKDINLTGFTSTNENSMIEENTNDSHILFTVNSDQKIIPIRDSKLDNDSISSNTTSDYESSLPSRTRDLVRRFNWSEAQQGILIGSFFWGYICTELPGGRLAEIIGARRVFGYATLGASVVTLLTPLSAKIHFLMAVIVRIILGLFLGVTWPSILPLAAKWIPPDERGKFLSNMMGSTLGAGFTLPICGFIIAQFSWEFVFYITGMLGFIWSILWFMLVFETPADHPRISPEERWYIETKLGLISSKDTPNYMQDEKQASQVLIINQSGDDSCLSDNDQKASDEYRNYSTFSQNGNVNGDQDRKISAGADSDIEATKKTTPLTYEKNNRNTKASETKAKEQSGHGNAPWFHILTSVPVWAFVLTHGASVFGYNTITNQLPTYMKYILHYNIKHNGVLSALPYIGKYIAALIGGAIADKLLSSTRFSKCFVRKMFTFIAVMIPGFLMIFQIFVGEDKVMSVIIFTAALTFNGCVTGGYLGNSLDIAPNYSGTVFGLGNMFSGLSGAVSAMLVGYLTDHNQVYGQWQKVFLIVAITYLVGATIFLVFGSTEIQHWNSTTKNHKKKTEVKKTNNKSDELHSLETFPNVS